MSHVLGVHDYDNGTTMLSSICTCDDPSCRDRGDVCSSDGTLSCDVVSSICFSSRETVLVDVRQVLDALLIEFRQGCEVSNAFVSNTKHRSILTELDVGG